MSAVADIRQKRPGKKASPDKRRQADSRRRKSPTRAERTLVHWECFGIAAVGVTILAVSLSHLATGITHVTGGAAWSGWAMAIAIDVGMVCAEVASITLGRRVPVAHRYAHRYVVATISLSAALNVLGFWPANRNPAGIALAVLLGCLIPVGVWHLVRVAGELWTWAHD